MRSCYLSLVQKEDICGTKHAFKNEIYEELESMIPDMKSMEQLVHDVVEEIKQLTLSDRVAQ